MKRLISSTLVAIFAAGPIFAQGYIPDGKLNITPLANGVRISGDTGDGPQGIWCAAADYARNHLGARSSQNLYVSDPRPKGLSRSTGVSFTLDPTGLTPSSVFFVGSSLSRQGAALTIGHALTFCADVRLPSR